MSDRITATIALTPTDRARLSRAETLTVDLTDSPEVEALMAANRALLVALREADRERDAAVEQVRELTQTIASQAADIDYMVEEMRDVLTEWNIVRRGVVIAIVRMEALSGDPAYKRCVGILKGAVDVARAAAAQGEEVGDPVTLTEQGRHIVACLDVLSPAERAEVLRVAGGRNA